MIPFVVEFLGTLLLCSVVISTGRPVFIAVAFFLAMFLGGAISGGYFNPAITVMQWAKGTLTSQDFVGYVVAQILGGLSALAAYRMFLRGALVKANLLA